MKGVWWGWSFSPSEGGGSRNGILQSLGAWIDLGLVLGAGLFQHGAVQPCSEDLA